MRKPFVAGNWKMNTNSNSSVELARALAAGVRDIENNKVDIGVYPPFVYLAAVSQVLGDNIMLGAQDVYFESAGAFTGEISCQMLKDVGCVNVLIGHSERRHVIGESDDLINKKLLAVISNGLNPTLCVGETQQQREAGETEKVVTGQVRKGLASVTVEQMAKVTIAYEPVWAIGTGLTATPDQAQQVHAMIRQLLADMYDQVVSENIRIQYGGSVKPDNAAELMKQKDIDGALVGGASLKAGDFMEIIKAAL